MRTSSEIRSPADSPNLFAALAELARRSPDGALATAATAGILGLMGLVIAQAAWRPYLLPLVSVGAFGLWGIAERDREAPPAADDASHARRAPAPATVVQWLAVTVGTAAAVLAAFALLGALFGSVIS